MTTRYFLRLYQTNGAMICEREYPDELSATLAYRAAMPAVVSVDEDGTMTQLPGVLGRDKHGNPTLLHHGQYVYQDPYAAP